MQRISRNLNCDVAAHVTDKVKGGNKKLYDAVLQANSKSTIYVTKLGSSGCVRRKR